MKQCYSLSDFTGSHHSHRAWVSSIFLSRSDELTENWLRFFSRRIYICEPLLSDGDETGDARCIDALLVSGNIWTPVAIVSRS